MFITWGTHFLLKKNPTSITAKCDNCGRVSKMASFDCMKFGHLYWIPLLPLGKYRIVDHCTRCDFLREIPLNEWNIKKDAFNLKFKSIAYGSFENAGKGVKFLENTSLFKDLNTSLEIARKLEDEFADDSEVLKYLAWWYQRHVMPEEANRINDSFSNTDPGIHDDQSGLAEKLFLEGQLVDAARLYQEIYLPGQGSNLFTQINLALKLAKTGPSREAFRFMTFLLKTYPKTLRGHDVFRRAYKKLELEFGIPETLLPKKTYKGPIIVAGAVLMVAIMFLGANAFDYFNQNLVLLNAFPVELEFEVQGEKHLVEANSLERIKVEEGEHLVIAKLPDGTIDRGLILVKNTFLQRYNRKRTAFVFNAFKGGVLLEENMEYSDRVFGEDEVSDYEIMAGKQKYEFRGIDYLFTTPPDEIEITYSGASEFRKWLHFVKIPEEALLWMAELETVSPDQLLDNIELQIKLGRNSPLYLAYYLDYAEQAEALARQEQFLSEYPELTDSIAEAIEINEIQKDLEGNVE